MMAIIHKSIFVMNLAFVIRRLLEQSDKSIKPFLPPMLFRTSSVQKSGRLLSSGEREGLNDDRHSPRPQVPGIRDYAECQAGKLRGMTSGSYHITVDATKRHVKKNYS